MGSTVVDEAVVLLAEPPLPFPFPLVDELVPLELDVDDALPLVELPFVALLPLDDPPAPVVLGESLKSVSELPPPHANNTPATSQLIDTPTIGFIACMVSKAIRRPQHGQIDTGETPTSNAVDARHRTTRDFADLRQCCRWRARTGEAGGPREGFRDRMCANGRACR